MNYSQQEILLISPSNKLIFPRKGECLGLGYLAASLRSEKFRVKLLDLDLESYSIKNVIEIILKDNPSIIGFSVLQNNLMFSLELARCIKDEIPGIYIIFGGQTATYLYKDLLNNYRFIDFVLRGEAEEAIVELSYILLRNPEIKIQLEKLLLIKGLSFRYNNETYISNECRQIQDLNKLPFPVHDYLNHPNLNLQTAYISSSRGCYNSCIYCCTSSFYDLIKASPWRARDPLNVANELEYVINNYRVYNFFFVDDNFIGPSTIGKKRALEISNEIIKRRLKFTWGIQCRPNDIEVNLFSDLKKAGLSYVFIGIESGTQEELDFYKRNVTIKTNEVAIRTLDKLNIPYTIGFIMFHPNSSFESINNNFQWLKKMNLYSFNIYSSKLEIYIGTELWKSMNNENADAIQYNYNYDLANSRINYLCQIFWEYTKKITWPFEESLSFFDNDKGHMKSYNRLKKRWKRFNIKNYGEILRLFNQSNGVNKIKSEFLNYSKKKNQYLNELETIKLSLQRINTHHRNT
jgi:anaerobic magnesium-protoporphyrin IX monomethyl ester cyclase